MSIPLQPNEAKLRTEITGLIGQVRSALAEGTGGPTVRDLIQQAGEKAHELHMLLKNRGCEPKHHAYMVKNRGMESSDSKFYMHVHPIEDLLKFLENEHANDDPIDQTLNSVFSFSVHCRRWGHADTYTLKRTVDGWYVSFQSLEGPCDKGGRPFLFANLEHDLIEYPEGLSCRLEWLWNQAAEKGLTVDQVQVGVQQLAEWVTVVETSVPSGELWGGY